MKRSRIGAGLQIGVLLACGVSAWSRPATAQEVAIAPVQVACGTDGYRVVARRWDVVLGRGWELRQDCAHSEWPARLAAVGSPGLSLLVRNGTVKTNEISQVVPPLLVHAGDRVRLWSQNQMVRIEMSGVVEQSAHRGDRVIVQITQQSEDTGMTVERITGIVRDAGDVEMGQ